MTNAHPIPLFHIDQVRSPQEYRSGIQASHLGLFDGPSQPYIDEQYNYTMRFLYRYRLSQATLKNYVKELDRYCAWAWQYKAKSLFNIARQDAQEYLEFFIEPPANWVSKHSYSKKLKSGVINSNWRPFVARDGNYSASNASVSAAYSILKSFYNRACEDSKVDINPFALIRHQSLVVEDTLLRATGIRKITDRQWQYIEATAIKLAAIDPKHHERTLFLISCMRGMYLRVSDLVPRKDSSHEIETAPMMKDFYRSSDNIWLFNVLGKGGVRGSIKVSNDVLKALKRWRRYLGLSPLPTPTDCTPIVPSLKGGGPICSMNQISNIIKTLFTQTALKMISDGLKVEGSELFNCSAYWVRHTGISKDVHTRPIENIRYDARHASMQTTEKYIES